MLRRLTVDRVGPELRVSPDRQGPTVVRWIGMLHRFDGGVEWPGMPQSPQVLTAQAALDFETPGGGSPRTVTLTMAVGGAAVGDPVLVGAPIPIPTNWLLDAYVSAADEVTVRWVQLAGSAADPDGDGGVYRVVVYKV